MNFFAIIPARYTSTRFPGKPLCKIGGTTMIGRVYNQVKKVSRLEGIYIATDDQRIEAEGQHIGANVIQTSSLHRSGTERCAEAALKIKNITPEDIVVNVQGDEPFIEPEQIEELLNIFSSEKVQLATLIKPIEDKTLLLNPNVVKVVTDIAGRALYFSRSAVPFCREVANGEPTYFQHIGIYGYRVSALQEIVKLKPSMLETAESLEQLRWLENGYAIHTHITKHNASIGIDTPEDLVRAEAYIRMKKE